MLFINAKFTDNWFVDTVNASLAIASTLKVGCDIESCGGIKHYERKG